MSGRSSCTAMPVLFLARRSTGMRVRLNMLANAGFAPTSLHRNCRPLSQARRHQRSWRMGLFEKGQFDVYVGGLQYEEGREDAAEHQAGQLDRIYRAAKGPITCILRILP